MGVKKSDRFTLIWTLWQVQCGQFAIGFHSSPPPFLVRALSDVAPPLCWRARRGGTGCRERVCQCYGHCDALVLRVFVKARSMYDF